MTARPENMLFAVGLVAASCLSISFADADNDKREPVVCVDVTAEARHSGIAYNHLVHLHNTCEFAVTCDVWTDVSKKIQTVSVPAKEKKTVLTWRNSPAREFTPKVDCFKQNG